MSEPAVTIYMSPPQDSQSGETYYFSCQICGNSGRHRLSPLTATLDAANHVEDAHA